MKFQVWKDENGEWRWHLKARNGRILADSGESYKRRVDCLRIMQVVLTANQRTPIEFLEDKS